MKILHVIDSLAAATGGPPVVAQAVAAAQAGLGHEVHLAAYAPGGRAAAGTGGSGVDWAGWFGLPNVPGGDRVCIHLLSVPGRFGRVVARGAGAWFDGRLPPADVTHLHGMWDPILAAAARGAARRGRRYVLTPHGMLDPWSLAQKRIKKWFAWALIVRRMLNGAAFLQALNADEASLIRPLGLSCPVEVIPNGIFPDQVGARPPAGTFYAARPELRGEPFVLFLGRLHPKKGLDYLADAFAVLRTRHPSTRLVVVGPDDGARAGFEQRVTALGVADRVHVVGPLYRDEKFAALADAAAFCLPSRQEGFSMAVTEAMACGVPAVVSAACHFPEVAAAGAGVVVPLDARAIAAALGGILSDPAAREVMGRAGRALVEARYTWPRIAAATVEAYERHGTCATSAGRT